MGSATKTCDTAGKVITCKAAVAWEPCKPLVVQDIQVDPPQAMEVRIKITHTSLCHTDITFMSLPVEAMFPRIFGHEGAGVVESVGQGVTDLKEGDHVIAIYTGECGSCGFCQSVKTNLCKNFKVDPEKLTMKSDGKTRFSADGKPIYHFMNTSTFSEYTVVDHACVVKIDPTLPLSSACLLGCGVATGIGAAWNTANVEADSTIAIFGLGTVGLAVAEGSRVRKASRIIGIDTNPDKFSMAKQFGVTEFINPKDHEKPIHEVLLELTDGGVDYSFECIGNSNVLDEAFLSTKIGWGTTIMLGFDSSLKPASLNPMDLFLGKKLIASMFGGFKGKTDTPILVAKTLNKEVNVEGFITHELPFSEIQSSFDLMKQGKCLRCVLTM